MDVHVQCVENQSTEDIALVQESHNYPSISYIDIE